VRSLFERGSAVQIDANGYGGTHRDPVEKLYWGSTEMRKGGSA
jgi:hypothetical protein